jgi:hypothetical protein
MNVEDVLNKFKEKGEYFKAQKHRNAQQRIHDSQLSIYNELDNSLKHNYDIVDYLLNRSLDHWKKFPDDVTSDKELIEKLLETHRTLFSKLNQRLRSDKNIIKTAVTFNGCALAWIPPKHKKDISLLKLAVANTAYAFSYVDNEYLKTPEVLLEHVDFFRFINISSAHALNDEKIKIIKKHFIQNNNKEFYRNMEKPALAVWDKLLENAKERKNINASEFVSEVVFYFTPMMPYWSKATIIKSRSQLSKTNFEDREVKKLLNFMFEKEMKRRSIMEVSLDTSQSDHHPIKKSRKLKF